MFDRDRVLTLDLGASKIVLAEFQVVKGGEPVLLRYGIHVIEGEGGSETDRLAYIVTAVRELMSEQQIRPASMLMTVSGQAVFPRFVKLPPVGRDKLTQIIQYDIRKRKNNVEVRLPALALEEQEVDEPLLQFGRDKPRETGNTGPAN